MADETIPPDDDLELDDVSDAGDQDDAPDSDEVIESDDESDDKDSQDQDHQTTEKRLKDTQAALTRKAQENKELRTKYDELNGKLEILLRRQEEADKPKEETPEDDFGFLDNEEEQKTLLDDPKNVAGAIKKSVLAIGKTLSRRDQFLLNEVKKIVGSAVTDEGKAINQRVAVLRRDADYGQFSDEQLQVIAKKQLLAKAKKAGKDTYKGGFGGRGGYRGGTQTQEDDVTAEANRFLKMLYPDDKFDDKE